MTLSPDGRWLWDGKEWIPAPSTESPNEHGQPPQAVLDDQPKPEQKVIEIEPVHWRGWFNEVLLALAGLSLLGILLTSVGFKIFNSPIILLLYSVSSFIGYLGILLIFLLPSTIIPQGKLWQKVLLGLTIAFCTTIFLWIVHRLVHGWWDFSPMAITIQLPFLLYPLYVFITTLIGYHFLHQLPSHTKWFAFLFRSEWAVTAWKRGIFFLFLTYGLVSTLSTVITPMKEPSSFVSLTFFPLLLYIALRGTHEDLCEFFDPAMSRTVTRLILLLCIGSSSALFISEFWFSSAHPGTIMTISDSDAIFMNYALDSQLRLALLINLMNGVATLAAIGVFIFCLVKFRDGGENPIRRVLKQGMSIGVMSFPFIAILVMIIVPYSPAVLQIMTSMEMDQMQYRWVMNGEQAEFGIIVIVPDGTEIENISKVGHSRGLALSTDFTIESQPGGEEWLQRSDIAIEDWFGEEVMVYNLTVNASQTIGVARAGTIMVDFDRNVTQGAAIMIHGGEVLDYGFQIQSNEVNSAAYLGTFYLCCGAPIFILASLVIALRNRTDASKYHASISPNKKI